MKAFNQKKIGILGGGQLGRMLLQSAIDYDLQTYVMDPHVEAPSKYLCTSFIQGSLMDYDDVYNFGKALDVITIEIEHVNVDALEQLEKDGVTVYPKPETIRIIQDKGLQNQFYDDHHIPTADFMIADDRQSLESATIYPAFQKLRKFGYDGRGVQLLKSKEDLDVAFEEPSVLEKYIEIEKELSVIVAANANGQIEAYPPVELVFNPEYNLVDYLIAPSNITKEQALIAHELALSVVEAFQSPGIFAIEMFLTKSGEILVNETAPRTHNSGHSSIEGNVTSQFEQHLRVLMDMPLGSTQTVQPSLMMNLIGAKDHQGAPIYEGMDQLMKEENVHVHLYGKKETRPGRKMGHVTILAGDRTELISKYKAIKNMVKIIS